MAILVPAVGTVPGFTDEELVEIEWRMPMMHLCFLPGQTQKVLPEVIEQIAIRNKVAGVDIQHIEDAGYSSLATVEIFTHCQLQFEGSSYSSSYGSLSDSIDNKKNSTLA